MPTFPGWHYSAQHQSLEEDQSDEEDGEGTDVEEGKEQQQAGDKSASRFAARPGAYRSIPRDFSLLSHPSHALHPLVPPQHLPHLLLNTQPIMRFE